MPDTRDKTPDAEDQASRIVDEQSSAIVEVPEIEHTAESLGIELPENREECERLLVRELGEARLEASELLGNLQRVAAEFDNYRKRTERDRIENVHRASQRVLVATTDTEAKMLEGMKSTHTQMLETLRGDGFAPIEAVGALFDPALHEAISVIPGEGVVVGHA